MKIEISPSEGAFFILDKEIPNTNMPFSISEIEISYSEGAFFIPDKEISNANMPFSISEKEIFYLEGAFSIPEKEISNTNMPFSISGMEISYSEGDFSISDKEISNMNMPFSISGMEVSPSEGAFCISDMEISIFEELFLKKMTLPRRPRRSRRRNSPKAAYWQWMNADPQELIRSIRRLLNKRRIIQLILVRFHIFFAPPYRTNNSSAKA